LPSLIFRFTKSHNVSGIFAHDTLRLNCFLSLPIALALRLSILNQSIIIDLPQGLT